MLLLHISDIHFNRDFVTSPSQDPDGPIRTQLIRHARQHIQSTGPVDAILFTGDIAFRGAKEEYEAAKLWLRELATAVQCDFSQIFTVPGNHDIDQGIIKANTSAHNAQLAIDQAADSDAAFRRQVGNERSTLDLLAPLAAYNYFSKEFGCDLSFGKLTWTRDLQLDSHTKLKLHGLTSCLISGVDATIDRGAGRQYVNRTQVVLLPEDNVIHATLCHHPPHWFRNAAEFNALLRSSARLQFFGHIHDQQIEQHGQNVRILAGATVPEYNKGDAQPAYNFVHLSVSPQNWQLLDVEISQFEWQPSPPVFRSKVTPEGLNVFRYTVPIERAPGGPKYHSQSTTPLEPFSARFEKQIPQAIDASQSMPSQSLDWRQAIDVFHSLPSSVRRDIAVELGVLQTHEFRLTERERENISLERIRQLSLQEEFQCLIIRKRG